MSVRCGNCKKDHPTAADVRECYVTREGTYKPPSDGPMWPASDKQKAYVLGLQDERALPDDYPVKSQEDLDKMERDEVSALIGTLKLFARKPGSMHTQQREWKMPAGRYAVFMPTRTQGGDWIFYEISKPTEGRWKGYTFIKRLVGAPGDYRKIDMPATERVGTLNTIEADWEAALKNYGVQSRVCGRCHSPLTDPDSLAKGIGPICAGKLGWDR